MTGPQNPDSGTEIRTACRICLASCGAIVTVDDSNRVVRVRGDKDHPRSKGYLCPKGPQLAWGHNRPDRLNVPSVRGRPTSWRETLDDLATRIAATIKDRGPDGFGLYLGTGCDLLGAEIAFRVGAALETQQVYSPLTMDVAPSLRAAEFVTGYAGTLAPHWDMGDTDVRLLVVFGSNPAISHNHLSIGGLTNTRAVWRGLQARGGRIWVLDPMKTRSAALADEHLAPKAGTDPIILAWLVRRAMERLRADSPVLRKTRSADRERLQRALATFDLACVAQHCGIEREHLERLDRDIAQAGRLVLANGSGVRFGPHGLVGEWLRWALLILTDSLEEPGGMWFDPGWRVRLDEQSRWSPVPEGGALVSRPLTRPDLPRWFGQTPCAALADEIERGSLRSLLIFGGNPITGTPNPDRLTRALRSLDAVAVIDIVPSELTDLASHVLPATGMLERTDITRLLNRPYLASLTPAVFTPQAQRRHSWDVMLQLADRLGVLQRVLPDVELAAVTEESMFRRFVAGARHSYEELRAAGPHGINYETRKRWALATAVPGGMWRLAPEVLVARLAGLLREEASTDYPLSLISGRQDRRLNRLQNVQNPAKSDQPRLRLSPADAARLGLLDGDRARVRSPYGALRALVTLDPNLREGVVQMPQGWPEANVTHLNSTEDVDPQTTQSQMTALPVVVEPDPWSS